MLINFILQFRLLKGGRIYTSHSILNMQGGELARGLIMFYKGEVLNDIGLRAELL